jgi:uncharacterized protein YjbI with pentapeptide repeats
MVNATTSITTAEQLLTAYASGQRDFQRINLPKAELSGVDLSGCNFTEANFQGADLRESNLSRCNLSRVNFKGARLRRTNLIGSTLQGADFQGANLYRAKLIRSDLQNADFGRADLRIGADLREANITNTNFKGALYDEYTKFPPFFDPIAAGM